MTHTYSSPGTFNLKLTAVTTSGATVTKSQPIVVNPPVVHLSISADTFNYVLNTSKVPGYVAGHAKVVLTINPGVHVGSMSTATNAFTVDNSWVAGDQITVVNNGYITGMGGKGGNGSRYDSIGNPVGWLTGQPGEAGGPAFLAQFPVSVDNTNGIIGGGGGGGGGGDGFNGGGGGGGGQGFTNSSGGSYGYINGSIYSASGQPGTVTQPGAGGFCGNGEGNSSGYFGGSGGALGNPGASGQSNGFGGGFGVGGSPGPAITGNSFLTWIAQGSVQGAVV